MNPPTNRQLRVLRFVAEASRRGLPPTVREIVSEFRLGSTNAANDFLKALTKKGLLEREPKKSRALFITDAGWRWLAPDCAGVAQ